MTARPPSEAEALLPFWVNDTLSEDERATVDRALAEDADLRARAEVLRRVRGTLRSERSALAGPGSFGLARLHRALDAEIAPRPRAGRTQAVVWAIGSAVAASLTTFAVLGPAPMPEPVYEQASGEPAGLVVTFAPDATLAEIGALLRDRGLTIRDGPSALGLFRLTVLPGGAAPGLDAIAQALEQDARILRVDIEE